MAHIRHDFVNRSCVTVDKHVKKAGGVVADVNLILSAFDEMNFGIGPTVVDSARLDRVRRPNWNVRRVVVPAWAGLAKEPE